MQLSFVLQTWKKWKFFEKQNSIILNMDDYEIQF
jgi:hypothetical protein